MHRDAIVLAGAKNNGALSEVSDATYEALIPLLHRPMIEYVIDALVATSSVGRIVVVGPRDLLSPIIKDRVTHILEGSESIIENIKMGMEVLNSSEMTLLATSDTPLLTPEVIEDFLKEVKTLDGDLFYPLISKEDNESLLPGVQRTYVRLREGIFTGGNLFLFSPHAVPICFEPIKEFILYRKNPIKLSRLLGVSFVIKFFFGQLSIKEIQSRMNRVLGIEVVPVISNHPVMGFDVDKPSDLEIVEGFLKGKSKD